MLKEVNSNDVKKNIFLIRYIVEQHKIDFLHRQICNLLAVFYFVALREII